MTEELRAKVMGVGGFADGLASPGLNGAAGEGDNGDVDLDGKGAADD